jgi:hypothetical protein
LASRTAILGLSGELVDCFPGARATGRRSDSYGRRISRTRRISEREKTIREAGSVCHSVQWCESSVELATLLRIA